MSVGLGWVAVASLTPLAHRPFPFGSANGSIWNVVFDYNGLDRAGGAASAAALRLDPPGPLRFLGTGGHQYLWLVGTALLAAIVLPVVALLRGWRPRPLAYAVFFAVWLVTGIVLLSRMQRMEPRYLETVTPAIAAVIGIAASRISQRRAVVAGCLAAALAAPAAGAVWVAGRHHSDAGLASRMTPAQLGSLSAYLTRHAARFEVASASVERAAPLIVRDGRPVLMLAGEGGRPLVTPAQLAAQVASGAVRYGLLSSDRVPAVRWALRHGRDVSAAAGLPPHTLYRLTATGRPTATARSAHRAGRPRA
jgi:hypothetical protein